MKRTYRARASAFLASSYRPSCMRHRPARRKSFGPLSGADEQHSFGTKKIATSSMSTGCAGGGWGGWAGGPATERHLTLAGCEHCSRVSFHARLRGRGGFRKYARNSDGSAWAEESKYRVPQHCANRVLTSSSGVTRSVGVH